MSKYEYQQYLVAVQWYDPSNLSDWEDCQLAYMMRTPQTINEMFAELRTNWWPKFVESQLDGRVVKGPYFTVVEITEDTWCKNDGFYWTYVGDRGMDDILHSWEEYRIRHGITEETVLCNCRSCLDDHGVVRMEVVGS